MVSLYYSVVSGYIIYSINNIALEEEGVDVTSAMSLPPRQHNEQQQAFLRQATILRKNLNAWEATICSARGEDWPSMLGRLNAAFVSIFFSEMVFVNAYTESSTDQFIYG